MITIQLEFILEVKGLKYLFTKEIKVPREPDIKEMIQVSVRVPEDMLVNHYLSVIKKIPMTEGDLISRYGVELNSDAARESFSKTVDFLNTRGFSNWKIDMLI